MRSNRVVESPIEELSPDWVGLRMEVDTQDGSRVGFRLARYEKTQRDGETLWILFSSEQPWRTEVRAGTTIRWVPAVTEPIRSAAGGDAESPLATLAVSESTQVRLSPRSWLTPPAAPPR